MAKRLAALILAVFILAAVATYERTVFLDPPETDMDVVRTGCMAQQLIQNGYIVILNGSILTLEDAIEMENF